MLRQAGCVAAVRGKNQFAPRCQQTRYQQEAWEIGHFRPDPRETAFSIVGYVFVGGLVVSLGVSAPEVSQQIADFAVTAVQPRPSNVEGQWNQNGRHRRFN
jgi:hypothetical protein